MYLDEPVTDRAQLRRAFLFLSTAAPLREQSLVKTAESGCTTSAKRCSHCPETFRRKPEVFQDL